MSRYPGRQPRFKVRWLQYQAGAMEAHSAPEKSLLPRKPRSFCLKCPTNRESIVEHVTPPSSRETAFNCPHCHALAHQSWYSLGAEKRDSNNPLPIIFEPREYPYIGRTKEGVRVYTLVGNVHLSECFNCERISVWVNGRLEYPRAGEAPPANPDLSDDIRRDYDEASRILGESPRGSAALIRLAIQKLCKELGQPGENLNDDIAALVKAGLDTRVQKALDSIRVIGNNAVHPGQMDLRDNRATAESLFGMLNLIADKMISIPKHIDEVYEKLPDKKRKAIEERDASES